MGRRGRWGLRGRLDLLGLKGLLARRVLKGWRGHRV